MTTQIIAEQQNRFVIKLDKSIERIIDSDTRKKLVNAYLKLFSGFAWVNWTEKQSLGCAWQNALGQCESFLKTKNKANPATKYLHNVAAAHKTYQSRIIMTNENSPNTINKTPEEIKRLKKYGIAQIREAMDRINLILARYNEYVEEITGIEKSSSKTAYNTNKQAKQVQQTQSVVQPTQSVAQPQTVKAAQTHILPQHISDIQKPNPMAQTQKAVTQLKQPQQIAQPQTVKVAQTHILPQHISDIQKPNSMAQMQKAVTQLKQPQQIAQPQTVKATQTHILPQHISDIQKPNSMAQTQKAVTQLKQPQQIAQPQTVKAAPQIATKETVAKKQDNKTVLPQQFTSLNSSKTQQMVQQRINLFIMAKYNQKVA